jgi:hypothetical protein
LFQFSFRRSFFRLPVIRCCGSDREAFGGHRSTSQFLWRCLPPRQRWSPCQQPDELVRRWQRSRCQSRDADRNQICGHFFHVWHFKPSGKDSFLSRFVAAASVPRLRARGSEGKSGNILLPRVFSPPSSASACPNAAPCDRS